MSLAWHICGTGPPYVRVGKRCLYPLVDLENWEATRIKQNEVTR